MVAILARVYAIHALVARITIVILIAILVVNEFWIHMMVAIGGIGEGFVSRLGAQGLPCVGGPRWCGLGQGWVEQGAHSEGHLRLFCMMGSHLSLLGEGEQGLPF